MFTNSWYLLVIKILLINYGVPNYSGPNLSVTAYTCNVESDWTFIRKMEPPADSFSLAVSLITSLIKSMFLSEVIMTRTLCSIPSYVLAVLGIVVKLRLCHAVCKCLRSVLCGRPTMEDNHFVYCIHSCLPSSVGQLSSASVSCGLKQLHHA